MKSKKKKKRLVKNYLGLVTVKSNRDLVDILISFPYSQVEEVRDLWRIKPLSRKKTGIFDGACENND